MKSTGPNDIRTAISAKGRVFFASLLLIGVYLTDPLGAHRSRSLKTYTKAMDRSVDCSTMDDDSALESPGVVCADASQLAICHFQVTGTVAIGALRQGAFVLQILDAAPKQGPPALTFAI